MTLIRKAFADDFDLIYPLLLEFKKHKYITKEMYQRLFIDHWNAKEGYFGYVMIDEGRAVGFLGMLFSQRRIGEKKYKFCHLTNWIVKEPYRGKSILMFLPILKLNGYTLVDLTPSKEVYALSKKAGFEDFETHYRILFPFPKLGDLRKPCRVITDEAVVKASLNRECLQIYQDHSRFGCKHVLIRSKQGDCYLVLTRLIRKKMPFALAQIHYISDEDVFLEHINTIKFILCVRLRVLVLFVDSRFLRDRQVSYSFSRALNQPRIFRGRNVKDIRMDTLYSESVVLNI